MPDIISKEKFSYPKKLECSVDNWRLKWLSFDVYAKSNFDVFANNAYFEIDIIYKDGTKDTEIVKNPGYITGLYDSNTNNQKYGLVGFPFYFNGVEEVVVRYKSATSFEDFDLIIGKRLTP